VRTKRQLIGWSEVELALISEAFDIAERAQLFLEREVVGDWGHRLWREFEDSPDAGYDLAQLVTVLGLPGGGFNLFEGDVCSVLGAAVEVVADEDDLVLAGRNARGEVGVLGPPSVEAPRTGLNTGRSREGAADPAVLAEAQLEDGE
jgi:hypothetical protein